jgi:hypothetical protein
MAQLPRSELETARRYASEAEARVIRQMAIIEELVRDNHPRTAHVARKILTTLSDSLDRARDHVRTLEEAEWRRHSRLREAPSTTDPAGTSEITPVCAPIRLP